jgi:DNA-binding response OmpR family regulator
MRLRLFDGLQGFEVVQNTSFDLVLLDWMLK